jgi:hypothetical protein
MRPPRRLACPWNSLHLNCAPLAQPPIRRIGELGKLSVHFILVNFRRLSGTQRLHLLHHLRHHCPDQRLYIYSISNRRQLTIRSVMLSRYAVVKLMSTAAFVDALLTVTPNDNAARPHRGFGSMNPKVDISEMVGYGVRRHLTPITRAS